MESREIRYCQGFPSAKFSNDAVEDFSGHGGVIQGTVESRCRYAEELDDGLQLVAGKPPSCLCQLTGIQASLRYDGTNRPARCRTSRIT